MIIYEFLLRLRAFLSIIFLPVKREISIENGRLAKIIGSNNVAQSRLESRFGPKLGSDTRSKSRVQSTTKIIVSCFQLEPIFEQQNDGHDDVRKDASF